MKILLFLSFFSLLASQVKAISTQDEAKPNIILVLVDDMGWMDLSCQGSDFYRTPHVDRLAREGILFTNGYAACAVCSPTRAAVQTGRYPHRLGVTDWIRSLFQRGGIGTPEKNPTEYVGGKNRKLLCPPNPYWMESSEITIAEALQKNMYKTAYIGKWHLGDEAWYPENQGYDENFGGCGRFITSSDGYYVFKTIEPGAYPYTNRGIEWRPKHIHFSLFGSMFLQRLITQMYFEGDPLIKSCPMVNSIPDKNARKLLVGKLDLSKTDEEKILGYQFDIILRGKQQTYFENKREGS